MVSVKSAQEKVDALTAERAEQQAHAVALAGEIERQQGALTAAQAAAARLSGGNGASEAVANIEGEIKALSGNRAAALAAVGVIAGEIDTARAALAEAQEADRARRIRALQKRMGEAADDLESGLALVVEKAGHLEQMRGELSNLGYKAQHRRATDVAIDRLAFLLGRPLAIGPATVREALNVPE